MNGRSAKRNQGGRYVNWVARGVLACVILSGLVTVTWCWNIDFHGCAVEELKESYKAGIAELSDMAKWILTLSVGLIGLFGSMAIGLRESPKLTPAAWALLLAAVCCFGITAYFALMWRTSVAVALFNGCPNYVASPVVTLQLSALTYFFVTGVAILAVILSLASWERIWGKR